MSRETEKLFKELHQYIDEHSGEDRSREGVEKLINSFMAQYNGNLPQPVTEDTAETSDDYLELAFNAETMKDAQRYAKKALQLDPFNFDADDIIVHKGLDILAEKGDLDLIIGEFQTHTPESEAPDTGAAE